MSDSYHSGYVAIMGHSNVGKSTLLNALLKQKIAPVSPRPQTTRKNQLGILSLEDAQIIFVDTPGVHQPRHKLGEKMNIASESVLADCDVILFMVDITSQPTEEDQLLADKIRTVHKKVPVILVATKSDLVEETGIQRNLPLYQKILAVNNIVVISATRGDNLSELLTKITDNLPEGPPLYPADQITDMYERDLAGELIREACLNIVRDEVPHGITVRVDQYVERQKAGAYIEATIFVERQSHKGIVIGQGGVMLKKIGTRARQEIEAMSDRKVFLRLRVKVQKNWRNDEKLLRFLGY
jgi:GTP-binding protein Era